MILCITVFCHDIFRNLDANGNNVNDAPQSAGSNTSEPHDLSPQQEEHYDPDIVRISKETYRKLLNYSVELQKAKAKIEKLMSTIEQKDIIIDKSKKQKTEHVDISHLNSVS